MVSDKGGLEASKILINADSLSDGYTELWKRRRLDLTVEALIVQHPEWHQLFTPLEVERARKRLMDYGYPVE
jgi:hypothetical protein